MNIKASEVHLITNNALKKRVPITVLNTHTHTHTVRKTWYSHPPHPTSGGKYGCCVASSRVYSDRGVNLTTHSQLLVMLRSRMRGAIPLLPSMS